ncbi:ABC transporter permease [Paenibacillus alginolyticus]|uniref:ABC transporter permease n=1 Tax=Paenibacillus alginolyticus TaxID=59839 RepID=A0ABT4GAI5_9BACL|nr:ABC transporter permease [Paenibacillus alginolyticus]MCY9693194.1 ABC transporter permease [Paenibacillus alginolyticus]MEC0144511.1 ABC transporter permease [Paenibacillus alginolyticus]
MKSWFAALGIPLIASTLAIIIGAVIVGMIGYNPATVYGSLFVGAFGNHVNISNTLAEAIPLLLIALGISLAFKAGFFNIGAQGQYWIGAIAATVLGTHLTSLPGWLHILVCLAGAMIAGGLWGGIIPGLAKTFRGVNEVVTTMMMGYIGTLLARFMIEDGPLRAEGTIPQSRVVDESVMLHTLVPKTQLTSGLFIVIAAVVLVWIIMKYTSFGYQIRAVGLNNHASRYAGINVALFTILSLALSGAFAGLAGGIQILAIDHRLSYSFSLQYGFTAIVVALLAGGNPLGCVASALFFSALHTGSQYIQMDSGVPSSLADVLTGMIIFFVAAERIFNLVMDGVRRYRKRHSTFASVVNGGDKVERFT